MSAGKIRGRLVDGNTSRDHYSQHKGKTAHNYEVTKKPQTEPTSKEERGGWGKQKDAEEKAELKAAQLGKGETILWTLL